MIIIIITIIKVIIIKLALNLSRSAFLGVGLESADKGVKITDVSEGSAAAKAGLKDWR